MFVLRISVLFFLFWSFSYAQTTYIDDFFSEKCSYCQNKEVSNAVILSDKPEHAWHNAHVTFSNKDYKKVNYYLLKDQKTSSQLKKMLQGYLFFRLKLYNESEKCFRDAVFKNDTVFHLIQLKSLADFYERKNYDSATFYSERILHQKKLPYKLKNEVYESLAFLNLSKKKFDKAEVSYLSLLAIYKKAKDSIAFARVYSNLGNLYFEQYKDEKAQQYFDSAYTVSKSLKNLTLKKDITHNLYIVSEALKEHENAVKYLKEYSAIKDTIQKENTIWQIAQQKETFNVAKKQAETDKRTAQRNVFIIVSIAVFLLLLITFLFYKKLKEQYRENQKLNKKLKEANELKSQIFSIVAHDLRSPVALLKQKFRINATNTTDDKITIDKKVVSIIDSLSFLLDNLLNWALSESNLLHIHKDWFPLLPVIKQIEHQYKSLIEEKKIELTISNLNSVLIFGDVELFKIVIRNCLDNAIKFTPKEGTIVISGKLEQGVFELNIQDSGIGISETVLKALFDLNGKKAQKDTEGRKSSGLGLHLVKSMIDINNGAIRIKNNPKGGTIVSISMPHKIIA